MQAAAPALDGGTALRERTLDRVALDRLIEDSRASASDELVILKDGVLVGDWNFTGGRQPIQSMSITKTVLSLAVGCLVDEGKLRLDLPVRELYPEWQIGDKRAITLFHLLSHTSGLEEKRTSLAIYASRSFVDFSLRSKLVFEPGIHYEYSNRGANLVSGIVGKAAGVRTDRYVAKVLFEPLGIRDYYWALDRAGHPQGLAGLHLLPADLAKLGQLVLNRGLWQGRRIVSEAWLRRSTEVQNPVQPPNKRLGLMWWLVPEWTRVTIDEGIVQSWSAAGVDAAFIAKVRPLLGRRFDSVGGFLAALRELFSDPKLTEFSEKTWKQGLIDARFEFGPVVGSYSSGTLGQYLVILPHDKLVAVRMRRAPKNPAERDDASKTLPDFVERVQALVR